MLSNVRWTSTSKTSPHMPINPDLPATPAQAGNPTSPGSPPGRLVLLDTANHGAWSPGRGLPLAATILFRSSRSSFFAPSLSFSPLFLFLLSARQPLSPSFHPPPPLPPFYPSFLSLSILLPCLSLLSLNSMLLSFPPLPARELHLICTYVPSSVGLSSRIHTHIRITLFASPLAAV